MPKTDPDFLPLLSRIADALERLVPPQAPANDLDASAQEIADLYKRRWAIELFFRWVKQTLKITRFVGTSENAIRIQIAVALIAFLLLRLAQAAQKHIQSPIVFARLVRANLMHRRPIDHLLTPPPPIAQDQRQMSLYLC